MWYQGGPKRKNKGDSRSTQMYQKLLQGQIRCEQKMTS